MHGDRLILNYILHFQIGYIRVFRCPLDTKGLAKVLEGSMTAYLTTLLNVSTAHCFFYVAVRVGFCLFCLVFYLYLTTYRRFPILKVLTTATLQQRALTEHTTCETLPPHLSGTYFTRLSRQKCRALVSQALVHPLLKHSSLRQTFPLTLLLAGVMCGS